MGKHAQSSAVQSSVQYGAEGSVLRNVPSKPHPAERLLKQAVWWIDAAHESAGSQTITNLGWGGSALNAQSGSTTGADSNDPKFLDWEGDNYCYLPGSSGNYMSLPDESALDITGDIDIRVKVALDSWTSGASQALVTKYSDTGNRRGWMLRYYGPAGAGRLRLDWSIDGTGTTYSGEHSNAPVPFVDGQTGWVRVTADVNNGAGGSDFKFYSSTDGSNWSQIGTTVTKPAVVSFYSGDMTINIGAFQDGAGEPATGKVYRAIVKNGIDGPTVLDVDTSLIASGSAASFAARTGQTVTINRSTSGRKAVAVTQPVWLFGTDDYMTVPDNDLLDFGAVESFTVLMACRVHATPKSFGFYIGKWNPGYYMGNSSSTTNSFFVVNDGVDQADTNVAGLYAPYMLGSVTLIGGVLDRSSSTLRSTGSTGLVPAGRSTTAVDSLATTNALMVGSSNDFEFISAAIFRRALTASEIGLLSDYFQGRD